MAAYFTTLSITDGLSQLFWGSSHEVQSPSQKLEEIFKKNLLDLPEDCDSKEKQRYIDNCLKAITNDLCNLDFEQPQVLEILLTDHLSIFDDAADRTLYNIDAKWVKSAFREGYAELIAKQWTASAAQRFYHVLLLSDPQDRLRKANLFREHFVKGTSFLKTLENRFDIPSEPLCSSSLIDKMQPAFYVYYFQAMSQRSEWIAKECDSFGQTLKTIEAKAKENPQLLNARDKEILECVNTEVSQITLSSSSCYEKKVELLMNCLIRQDSPDSSEEGNGFKYSFEQLFEKLDQFHVEFLYSR